MTTLNQDLTAGEQYQALHARRMRVFGLIITVDVIGQYVLNTNGGGRMRRSWDEERGAKGKAAVVQ